MAERRVEMRNGDNAGKERIIGLQIDTVGSSWTREYAFFSRVDKVAIIKTSGAHHISICAFSSPSFDNLKSNIRPVDCYISLSETLN